MGDANIILQKNKCDQNDSNCYGAVLLLDIVVND